MTKFIVRAFVLALAVTGVAATSVSRASITAPHAKVALTDPNPVPVCPPRDPSACGLD